LALLALAAQFPSAAVAQTSQPLISFTNTVWRYNDSGTDLGTAWRASTYPSENQSPWRTGRGFFGVESTVPYPYPETIRTPLVLNAGRTTYYFRTRFNVSFDPAGLTARATLYVDDGAVVYLNGIELRRVRLPANGPIAFTNKAELAPEGVPVVIDFSATNLIRGDNVLAVEVHQHSDTSSDIVFGCSLAIATGQRPVITDPSEPADRVVAQDASTVLTVSATGLPPPNYQWFKDGVAVSGATGPALALFNMTESQAGNYYCQVSNLAGSTNSRTAVVGFLPDTNGPVILYALGQPANPYEVLVVFSEAPNEAEAADGFNWEIPGLTVLSGSIERGSTRLTLTTIEPRDPAQSYLLRLLLPLSEIDTANHGNVLPAGTEVPIALFESTLIQNEGVQTWRYDQSGSDLSTNWIRPNFNDSGWLTGTDPFDAYRDGLANCRPSLPGTVLPVRTCLALSNAANTTLLPAIYFRTHFTFDGDPAGSVLRLSAVVDDGAVFHLNGTELARLGMPDGPVTYNTAANRDQDNFEPAVFEADAPSLVTGDNVLAVEVHQTTAIIPDLTFSLKLTAVLPTRPRPRLTARLTGGNLEMTWSPEDGILESADDPSAGWSPVVEAHAPGQYIAPPSAAKRFYRVTLP